MKEEMTLQKYFEIFHHLYNLPTTNSSKIFTDKEIDEAVALAKHFAIEKQKLNPELILK